MDEISTVIALQDIKQTINLCYWNAGQRHQTVHRQEKQETATKEDVLATFDIYVMCILLPIFTFDLYADEGYGVFFGLAMSISAHSYYITILCSTICRYVAVYHPFSFKVFFEKWRIRFVAIIVCVTVFFFATIV